MNIRELAHQNRNIILLVIILLLCLLSLFLQDSRLTQIPERVGMNLGSNIVLVFNNVKTFFTNTIRSVDRLRDLQIEYNQLLSTLEEQETSVQNTRALEQENRSLRQILDYSGSLEYVHLPAQVIGKDPGQLFSNLIVNKGNRHGVEIAMPVIAFQDGRAGLIGKVVDFSWNSSIIRPLIDPQSFVSGRLTKTRYEGLLRGRGNGSELLLMEYLNRNSRNQISVGDEVITSGLESVYPANIFVGTVTGVSTTAYSASLELAVLPFIDYTRLEHVFILLDNGKGR